jgi:hypothetical protein
MNENNQKKSNQDKLDKLILQKTNETEALKELLKKLNDNLVDNQNNPDKK